MQGLLMNYPLTLIFESVPKTSVGKFDKKLLRERFKDY